MVCWISQGSLAHVVTGVSLGLPKHRALLETPLLNCLAKENWSKVLFCRKMNKFESLVFDSIAVALKDQN